MPMKAPMVVVAGTIAFDVVAEVDRLPQPDEAVRLRHLVERPGGAAGNVAMGLARLGLRPVLLSSVGPDFVDSDYQKALVEAGVVLDHVVTSDSPTSRVFLFTDPDERQQIYSDPGAAVHMDMVEAPDGATLGHFSAGDFAAYPPIMGRMEQVTFDPGQEIFQRPYAEFEACLPHVDILFLNEHEKAHIEANMGRDLLEGLGGLDRPPGVVISRGSRGCTIYESDDRIDVPAAPVRVRDPTGAGDAHRAGFVFGLVHGLNLEKCARLAGVTAAFAVEARGTQDGLPSTEDLQQRYEETWKEWPL